MMKRIDLKTGFLCNNNCQFCVQAHKKKFGNRDTDELKRSLSQAAQDGYREVVLTGGEPTIRPDILELTRYAKMSGFDLIQVQTNGRRFADFNFCRECIEAGVNDFSLALHGHHAALHDGLTQSEGSFMQTVRGIFNLKKLHQRVMTNTVITKANYRYLPHIALLLTKLHVDKFQLAFVHAMGSAWDNFDAVVPRKSKVILYVKEALDIGVKAGVQVTTEAIPYCLMAGYESYVGEEKIPETRISDGDSVEENFNETRRRHLKIKAKQCRTCRYFVRCEGPWKEYPDHFGWDEFRPI